MGKLRNNQTGSAVMFVLVLTVIVLVGVAGWLVYKNHHKTTASVTTTTSPSTKTTLKTYSNSGYGFSFQYASNWTITNDIQNTPWVNGGTIQTGDVIAESPAGTKVDFNLNPGGKGGDCGDPEASLTETPRTCYTVDTLSLTPFDSGLSGRTFYYYETKVTPPTSKGGSVTYMIGLADNENKTPTTGSSLVDVPVDVISAPNGDLNISYSGKDDSSNSSQAFLTSNEVTEAASVLKTLQLTAN